MYDGQVGLSHMFMVSPLTHCIPAISPYNTRPLTINSYPLNLQLLLSSPPTPYPSMSCHIVAQFLIPHPLYITPGPHVSERNENCLR